MISLGLPFLASVPFFSEWLSLTFNGSHDPCVGKRSDLSRGDGSGRMEDGEEEEGKGLIMWFCVGQDCPPLLTKSLLGGGYFGPLKTMTVTAPGSVLDDESAVGWTTVLARWRDDESAAGRTTVLARWRDEECSGADDSARPLARRRVGSDDGARPLARRRVGGGADDGARPLVRQRVGGGARPLA